MNKSKKPTYHNAVIMINPNPTKTKFENNCCPYEERMKHGLVALSKQDVKHRGIKWLKIVALPGKRYGEKFEQGCQYQIDHLRLGTQRLHRVPGAGNGLEDKTKTMLIGATYLPPNFWENNHDLVIVGSKSGRNGFDNEEPTEMESDSEIDPDETEIDERTEIDPDETEIDESTT